MRAFGEVVYAPAKDELPRRPIQSFSTHLEKTTPAPFGNEGPE